MGIVTGEDKKLLVGFKDVEDAYLNIKDKVKRTELEYNEYLSKQYSANIYLKREDMQVIRSYKIRGAYNKMSSLDKCELEKGVVAASAGNHSQGVAYSCKLLKTFGKIFMPTTTPKQKVDKAAMFGADFVDIVLVGDTFDDAFKEAKAYCDEHKKLFIHPFDDPKTIAGQGTVGIEILEDAPVKFDFLFMPVGGGGLSAGVSTYFKKYSPTTQIIGSEPEGAPALFNSVKTGSNETLKKIDKFVDGAAVQKIGDVTFPICRDNLDKILLIPEGKACSTIIELYNNHALIVEPAGALSISSLDFMTEEIKGKNVCCVVSGGNNDISRIEEIRERSLFYEKLKHYFVIRFAQRSGALREFLDNVLGPNDDIVHFQYTKKNNREKGPALVGIELKDKNDYPNLIEKMETYNIRYTEINGTDLYNLLI